MGLMVSEVYEALVSAGAPKEQARAAAAAIPAARDMAAKHDIADMATKHDIADMATKQDVAELKQDIAVLKFAVFTFLPVIFALLAKLVFFP